MTNRQMQIYGGDVMKKIISLVFTMLLLLTACGLDKSIECENSFQNFEEGNQKMLSLLK